MNTLTEAEIRAITLDTCKIKTLAAPPGDDNCDPLALVVMPDRLVSYWKPAAHELKDLNGGGHINLHVFGHGHPPVALTTQAANAPTPPVLALHENDDGIWLKVGTRSGLSALFFVRAWDGKDKSILLRTLRQAIAELK